MKANYRWLNISMYTSQHNWNRIIPEIGYFMRTRKRPERMSFILELNNFSGENIRLSILSKDVIAYERAKEINLHFRQFLATLPVSVNQEISGTSAIFMDFPENSLQYGLYETPLSCDLLEVNSSIQKMLSDLIIDLFRETEVTDEILLMFAFYLDMGLIKSVLEYSNLHLEELMDYHLKLFSRLETIAELCRAEFTANNQILKEVKTLIVDANEKYHLESWIERWITKCNETIKRLLSNGKSDGNIILIYKGIRHDLTKQLGLRQEKIAMLSFFVNNIFLQ